jgi:CHAD domain-containing protein
MSKLAKHAVDATARSLVAERLRKVTVAIERARGAESSDPELIHKLRVASRIARAALDTFSGHLPDRKRDRLKRELRRLHRACGEVRDWDVLIDSFLASTPQPDDSPAFDALLGWAAARRLAAHRKLGKRLEEREDRFERMIERWNSDTPDATGELATFARSRLGPHIHAFQEAVAAESEDATRLHAIRIAGKRLRYQSEVLKEWLPPTVTEPLTTILKSAQDILGRYHDGVVAEDLLHRFAKHVRTDHPGLWERIRTGVERLGDRLRATKDAERLRFGEWRERWLAAGCPCPDCSRTLWMVA